MLGIPAVLARVTVLGHILLIFGVAIAQYEEQCDSPPLCNQQPAYFSVARNATTVLIHNHGCIGHAVADSYCILCGQLSTTKQARCSARTRASVALEFDGDAVGPVVVLEVVSYTKRARSVGPSDFRNISVTRKVLYVMTGENSPNLGAIEQTEPEYGAVIANDLYIGLQHHGVALERPTHTSAIHPQTGDVDGADTTQPVDMQLRFVAVGVFEGTYQPELTYLSSGNIEPASWFFSMVPQSIEGVDSGGMAHGYAAHGYIEFVLRPDQIMSQRRYVTHKRTEADDVSRHSVQALAAKLNLNSGAKKVESTGFFSALFGAKPQAKRTNKANICVWSSDNLDGQKRIWLDQTEHLDASKFEFTWILSLTGGRTMADSLAAEATAQETAQQQGAPAKTTLLSSVRNILALRQNGRVVDSPYNNMVLDVDALEMDPGDGRLPASHTWNGDEMELYRYAHESLILANYTIDRVQPLWCRQFYTILRDALPPLSCSAIVYGNERGFSADVLVTDAARILGIPTVAELLNLYVHKDVLPTVMVAPSTFAVEHESIQAALNERYTVPATGKLGTLHSPLAAVIPPAVDTARLDPAIYRGRKYAPNSYAQEGVYAHPACEIRGEVPRDEKGIQVKPCVIVGFLARLSPEKNVGLFLQAAHSILQLHPFTRFTIVGDGVLRASLEELAARLQIAWAVHFVGWVGASDLPTVLAGVDIIVNPSLRAWSETFCIANVEAMSMELPLVTFAVGGVGEYVAAPSEVGFNETTEFSVSENAVVLHHATPAAVANAVFHLIRRPELRKSIGEAARRTVERYFATSRQMRQYEELYSLLHEMAN